MASALECPSEMAFRYVFNNETDCARGGRGDSASSADIEACNFTSGMTNVDRGGCTVSSGRGALLLLLLLRGVGDGGKTVLIERRCRSSREISRYRC